MGLRADLETRALMFNKTNTVTVRLRGCLYLEEKAELIGYGGNDIGAATKGDERRLKL